MDRPPLPPPAPPVPCGPAIVETHISTLVFVGDRVWKSKKSVDLGFADLRGHEARRHACAREVALNRRLAPDVYLGVADVLDETGRPDHLVVMRRLDPERRLATLLADGHPDGRRLLVDVGRRVGNFHRTADRSSAISAAGRSESLEALWDDSTAELLRSGADVVSSAQVDAVAAAAHRFLRGRRRLLDSRVAAGWIVDGHGDLRAEDIFCLDDGPRILDCIDFDDALRHVDVLADIAFLVMDVERLGGEAEVAALVSAWVDAIGVPDVVHPALLHHFVAQRAQVRAKVACLRLGQLDPRDPGAPALVDEARQLLGLCADHLDAGRIRLVVVGGAPGVGKTTVADRLGAVTGWPVLHSDMVRSDVVAPAPFGSTLDAGRYRPAARHAVYRRLLDEAGRHLELGASVIVDASWSEPDHRRAASVAAERHEADLVELWCRCDPALAAERVASRPVAGGSEATPEVARAIAGRFAPWPTAGVVDTSGSGDGAVDDAVRLVGRW